MFCPAEVAEVCPLWVPSQQRQHEAGQGRTAAPSIRLGPRAFRLEPEIRVPERTSCHLSVCQLRGRGEVGSGGVASCGTLLHGNCSCSLTFAKGTQWYEQTKEELMAPTLLPELHLLKQVCGMGPRELCPGVNSSRAAFKTVEQRPALSQFLQEIGEQPPQELPGGCMGWDGEVLY